MKKLFLVLLFLLSAPDAFAQQYNVYPPIADSHFSSPVASVAALPATGNNTGDYRIETTTFNTYAWNGAAWVCTSCAAGGGTVTSFSVVNANGFFGSVTNPTTTPALTITAPGCNGVCKSNATAISTATSGTDYSAGTSGLATGIIKSTTATGALTIAVAGDFPTLNQNTTGTAANLSGTPALPNGTTATTQAAADNSTKIATTAYSDNASSNASVLSKLLTGYVAGAGALASTDSILQSFNKIGGNASTYELLANKDTDGTLAANSDVKYPSQKAVKTYADTGLALKQNILTVQQGVYHISKNGTDSASCGSVALPCLTGTQALSNFGPSTSAADVKQPGTFYFGPGSYDEALTIPDGRIITLVGEGTVVIGNGSGVNWASTVARSVTWTVSAAGLFGSDIKPSLNFIALPGSDATSTFIAEAGNFTISGNLVVAGDGTTKTLNTSNVKVWGNISHTDAALVNWQSYKTIVVGTVSDAGNMVLERAYDSRFNGLFSVNAVNMAANSNFPGGITVQSIQQNLLPNGFFHCNIGGTFTGPALSARFDDSTDYYFTQNAAALAGGATKNLIANIASGTLTGLLSTTDWTTFNNKVSSTRAINTTAPITGGGDLSADRTFAMHVADATHDGYLSLVDWGNFNSAAGGGITSLTGDVTGTGPGATATTIANGVVTTAKLANMVTITKVANYTLLTTDTNVDGNGTFNFTLPVATSTLKQPYVISNIGAGVLTILPNGADTIISIASITINPGQSATLSPDGVSNWKVQ